MITVATVLRSGGEFVVDHVRVLGKMVADHCGAHRFVCMTDAKADLPGITMIPLKHSLPGWWSKMEVLSIPGPALYIDLDTMVVGDLQELAKRIEALPSERFVMLQRLRQRGWASGIMAWNADWSWVLEKFLRRLEFGATFVPGPKGWRLETNERQYWGDQGLLSEILRPDPNSSWPIMAVQELEPEIYSYRNEVRRHGVSADARIVYFHGQPRPWHLGYALPQVRRRNAKKRSPGAVEV